MQIWYKVGSNQEPHGWTGLSHMLEHMMFKGTPLHPEGEFTKLIDAVGGTNNAQTSHDYTVYFEVLAKEHVPLAFELKRIVCKI